MHSATPRMQSKIRYGFPLPALALAAGLLLAPQTPQAQSADQLHPYVSPWKTPWDYQGARGNDRWADLDPAYAACKGKEQSPVDIRHTQKVALPALRFEYHSGPLQYIVNNGHTIRVNYYAPGSGDFLTVGDERYQLTQFHFHRPSEESVHGKRYDMVLHLMHQTREGKVAGVAVFLKAGPANPAVQQIWDHMPATEGQNQVSALDLNPARMLPGDTAAYYMYMGSVTAPPCTEGVTWFVLKTPITVSPQQIRAFAELYPNDVRPVQPLNGRIVKETM
ncbi:MAG: carbonic anhydrase family protein [Steroidobacteraceae bacterium]